MTAGLQFVSFSRRGIGAAQAVAHVGSRREVTASVTVSAHRQGQQDPPPVSVDSAPIAILGPGDVVGVPGEQVVRRSPRPGSHNLEPNYLAAIEFAHPDLPWAFSPVDPDGDFEKSERLTPWLMLVVLDQGDNGDRATVTVRPNSPCPVVRVPDAADVPSPDSAWAWAHVQVHNTDREGALRAIGADEPVAPPVRSRILCPTRLSPDRGYVAVLVPTFEAGRRVGLGKEEADAGLALWTPAAGLELPVYDSWQFRTGPAGDFETLARKLRPITGAELEGLGERTVTIEARASLMQRADGTADLFEPVLLRVPTAIAKTDGHDRPGPLAPDSPTPDPGADDFHRRLKELVDIVAEAQDDAPVVGPPLYGRWPARVHSIDDDATKDALQPVPPGTAQTWIEQLNADPALRMAAGVATSVVQHDQEELMTAAWAQLADVLAANSRIRWSRLFASAATVMHTRLSAADAASALRTTAPAFGRVLVEAGRTVRTAVDGSTLPREVLGAAFVRAARYSARTVARERPEFSVMSTVAETVDAVRASQPAVLPARFTAARVLDPDVLGRVLGEQGLSDDLGPRLGGVTPGAYLQRINELPADLRTIATRFEEAPDAPAHGEPLAEGLAAGPRIRIAEHQVEAVNRLALDVPAPAAHLLAHPLVARDVAAVAAAASPTISLRTVAAANRLPAAAAAEAVGPPVDLTAAEVRIGIAEPDAVTKALAGAAGLSAGQTRVLDADVSLRSAALSNLGITSPALSDLVTSVSAADAEVLTREFAGLDQRVSPIGSVLAAPDLVPFDLGTKKTVVDALEPEAAYGRLLAYAHSDVSDAVSRRQPHSEFFPVMASPHFPQPLVERLKVLDEDWVLGGVTRLAANSICLLEVNWSFVEAFLAGANHEMARELLWRGYPTDLMGTCFRQFWPSATPDISDLVTWTGDLGGHRPDGSGQDLTLVVVKGDLLRRYPSTLVSAERGKPWAKDGDEQFTSDQLFAQEVFRGSLGEDVTYVALAISPQKLRTDIDDHDPRRCWYISLLEPHDEPRFGLDEPATAPDHPVNADPQGTYSTADDWTWYGVPAGTRHLTPEVVFAKDRSAAVGASLFQRPFRLMLRAPDYLPAE